MIGNAASTSSAQIDGRCKFTGPICKVARSLVQASRAKLAANTGVDRETIETFERGIEIPDGNTVSILKEALENLGAVFIPEEGANGAGVRLKFSRSVTSRLDNLVNEGSLRWTRLLRQFGGLAKVDQVGFYAASCSIISAVA